ncbi:hypothetical protein LZ30DRAFT_11270 [Colletotrichum cereale]|nr:hypothetical protein LZ30DRAFT_11270 [Colletotrichum cereale]
MSSLVKSRVAGRGGDGDCDCDSFSLNQTRRLLVSVCSNERHPARPDTPGRRGQLGQISAPAGIPARMLPEDSSDGSSVSWSPVLPMAAVLFHIRTSQALRVCATERRDITSPALNVCSRCSRSPTMSQQRPPFSCLLAFPRETFQTERGPQTDVVSNRPSLPPLPRHCLPNCPTKESPRGTFCVVMRTLEERSSNTFCLLPLVDVDSRVFSKKEDEHLVFINPRKE